MKPLVTIAAAGAEQHRSRLVTALAAGSVAAPAGAKLGLTRDVVVEGARTSLVLADGPARTVRAALGRADALLLVVDVALGPQANTRDAAELAAALGVTQVISYVVTSEATAADASLLDVCEVLLREQIEEAGLDANAAPIVRGPVDVVPDSLRDALDAVTPKARDLDAPLAMPVSFTFFVPHFGTVVTGLVLAGRARKNAQVRCIGTRPYWAEPNVVARIGNVEQWRSTTEEVEAGSYAGLALTEIKVVSSVAPPLAGRSYGVPAPPAAQRAPHIDAHTTLVVDADVPLASVVELEVLLTHARRGGRAGPLLPGARPIFAFGGPALDGIIDAGSSIEVGRPTRAAVALRKELPLTPGMRCAIVENGRTVGRAVVVRALPDHLAPTSRRMPRSHSTAPVTPGGLVNA